MCVYVDEEVHVEAPAEPFPAGEGAARQGEAWQGAARRGAVATLE